MYLNPSPQYELLDSCKAIVCTSINITHCHADNHIFVMVFFIHFILICFASACKACKKRNTRFESLAQIQGQPCKR